MHLFKKFPSRSKDQSKARVPVEVAALLLLGMSFESVASTDPSWTRQPAWSDDTPSSSNTSSRKARGPKSSAGAFSPFSPGSNNLSIDVGQVFLMGDLSTKYDDNIGSQIHYTYGVSDLFGFDASVGYSDHSDGKFSMITALTGLRMNLAWYDKVIPYCVFGLGFYKPSFQLASNTSLVSAANANTGGTVSPILFGVHLGPGVDLELTKQLFFGASLTFHDVFGAQKATTAGPLDVGGTFTSFRLRAGVSF